jgi:hypothetical protein
LIGCKGWFPVMWLITAKEVYLDCREHLTTYVVFTLFQTNIRYVSRCLEYSYGMFEDHPAKPVVVLHGCGTWTVRGRNTG